MSLYSDHPCNKATQCHRVNGLIIWLFRPGREPERRHSSYYPNISCGVARTPSHGSDYAKFRDARQTNTMQNAKNLTDRCSIHEKTSKYWNVIQFLSFNGIFKGTQSWILKIAQHQILCRPNLRRVAAIRESILILSISSVSRALPTEDPIKIEWAPDPRKQNQQTPAKWISKFSKARTVDAVAWARCSIWIKFPALAVSQCSAVTVLGNVAWLGQWGAALASLMATLPSTPAWQTPATTTSPTSITRRPTLTEERWAGPAGFIGFLTILLSHESCLLLSLSRPTCLWVWGVVRCSDVSHPIVSARKVSEFKYQQQNMEINLGWSQDK